MIKLASIVLLLNFQVDRSSAPFFLNNARLYSLRRLMDSRLRNLLSMVGSPMDIRLPWLTYRAQSWNVLRNPRIAQQREDSYIALRNPRIAQILGMRARNIIICMHG